LASSTIVETVIVRYSKKLVKFYQTLRHNNLEENALHSHRCKKHKSKKTDVGFEILTAVVMKSCVLWDLTPCSDVSEDDGDDMFLLNVGSLSTDYKALYILIQYSFLSSQIFVSIIKVNSFGCHKFVIKILKEFGRTTSNRGTLRYIQIRSKYQ
jgi:hypothetical protein